MNPEMPLYSRCIPLLPGAVGINLCKFSYLKSSILKLILGIAGKCFNKNISH